RQQLSWHHRDARFHSPFMGRMRLLLVEDNETLAANVAKTFRAKGYAVDAVGTADDASAALGTQPYDLLILDLGLPDGDGLVLLRARQVVQKQVLLEKLFSYDEDAGLNAI